MQSRRVLIVDDEPALALLLAKGLSKICKQMVIDTAYNGLDALKMLGAGFYQLVITDYRMPHMNGLDLAVAVRDLSPATQVVLMTSDRTALTGEKARELRLDGYLDKPFTLEKIHRIVEDVLSITEGEDPYRTGEFHVESDVQTHLQDLLKDTGARCVMLLSAGGYPVEVAGVTEDFDINTTGTLIAANFMAAVELSKLLGNVSVFKSSYHEGPDYNIYAYDVNSDLLLAVIFGAEIKTGAVWFYTKQTASALAKLDLNQVQDTDFAEGDLTTSIDMEFTAAFNAQTPEFKDPAPKTTKDPITHVATKTETETQPRPLMTLEDAIAAGIVPADLEHSGATDQRWPDQH